MTNDGGACFRYPRLWIALLVVVFLSDAFAPLAIAKSGSSTEAAVMVLCLSQLTLHAGWLTLGPGSVWLRVGSIPVACMLALWLMRPMTQPDQYFFQLMYLVHWVIVCIALLAIRGVGFRLERANEKPTVILRTGQFAMSELAATVTVVCFVAAIFTRIPQAASMLSDLALALTWGTLLLLVVPPIFAVLIPRAPWLPALATLSIPLSLTSIIGFATGVSPNRDMAMLFCIFGRLTAIQLAAWGFVRFEGYRLWRESNLGVAESLSAETAKI